MTFDLNQFKQQAQPRTTSTPSKRKAKSKRGYMFLKGPIPWEWLSVAGKLSGKSLHVAVILWHLFGLTKSETVKIQKRFLEDLGVFRKSYYNAIGHLEKAGLISVERKQGAGHKITLQGLPDKG